MDAVLIASDSFLGSCLGVYLIVTPLLLFAIFSILFVINLGMPTGFSLAGSFNMEQSLTSIDHRLGTITENKDKSNNNKIDWDSCPVDMPYTCESKIIERAERALWEKNHRRPNNNKQEDEAMSKEKKTTKKHRILGRTVGLSGGMCGACGAEFTIMEGKVQRCPECGHEAKLKGIPKRSKKERIRMFAEFAQDVEAEEAGGPVGLDVAWAERARILEGDLVIARIAIMQQAKTIKKLKAERGGMFSIFSI